MDIDGLKEVFTLHWQDESWHEILRLKTLAIDSRFAGELVEFLVQQDGEQAEFMNLFLAAEYLSNIENLTGLEEHFALLLESSKNILKDFNIDISIKQKLALLIADKLHPDSEVISWFGQNINNYGKAIGIISLNNSEALSILKEMVIPTNRPCMRYEFGRINVLRTRLTDPQALIRSLNHLDIPVKLEADVRAGNIKVKADIVAVLKGSSDIGWSKHSDGSYNSILDLCNTSRTYNLTEFMYCINNCVYPLFGEKAMLIKRNIQ